MLKNIFIETIRVYRIFSRFIFPNPVCRFEPSCSEYSIGAISRYGAFKGAWMSVYRLMRCNPFCAGGYDPVK